MRHLGKILGCVFSLIAFFVIGWMVAAVNCNEKTTQDQYAECPEGFVCNSYLVGDNVVSVIGGTMDDGKAFTVACPVTKKTPTNEQIKAGECPKDEP